MEHARPHPVPIRAAAPFGLIAADIGGDVHLSAVAVVSTAIEIQAPDHAAVVTGQVERDVASTRKVAVEDATSSAVAECRRNVATQHFAATRAQRKSFDAAAEISVLHGVGVAV